MQPYLNAINQETSSVTVKHLSSRTIEEIPLPFPPLPEQRRIVARIEELFSELDNGIANLKKAGEQLKTYRQAVLKQAFEGKLTEEWRKERISNKEYRISNDEVSLAAEDRERYDKSNKLPPDWSIKNLGDFINKIEAGKVGDVMKDLQSKMK